MKNKTVIAALIIAGLLLTACQESTDVDETTDTQSESIAVPDRDSASLSDQLEAADIGGSVFI